MWECGCGHGEVSAVAIPDQYKPVRLESSSLLGSPQALNTNPSGTPILRGPCCSHRLGWEWIGKTRVWCLVKGSGYVRSMSEVCLRCVRGVSGVCLRCVQGESEVCLGRVQGVSRVCPRCVRDVSEVCPGRVRGVSEVYPRCVQGVSGVSPGCVWDVSGVCPGCVQGVF